MTKRIPLIARDLKQVYTGFLIAAVVLFVVCSALTNFKRDDPDCKRRCILGVHYRRLPSACSAKGQPDPPAFCPAFL